MNKIIIKILNNPKTKKSISLFVLFSKLNPTTIGKTGNIQGDKIESTPVKNEIKGIISMKIT